MKRILYIIASVALMVFGVVYGRLTATKDYTARAATAYSYHFPMLDPSVGTSSEANIVNFESLRQSVQSYLQGLNVSHSFYFEYLPDGISIRDGEDNVSQAASLMKVPIVMDLYKMVEQGQLSLNNTVTVEPVDIDPDPTYGNPTKLKVGDTLTLQQAAQITLKYSDNTTLNLIKGQIDPLLEPTNDSIRSLDLAYTVTGPISDEQVSISALSYSSVLKCLYFSCFDSAKDSSTILTDMVGSSEPNRLAAGVPPNIKIAHKVGSGGTTAQSDCGIVYYPNRPYVICLMFFNLGQNVNPDQYFQHVSQMIYNYIRMPTS